MYEINSVTYWISNEQILQCEVVLKCGALGQSTIADYKSDDIQSAGVDTLSDLYKAAYNNAISNVPILIAETVFDKKNAKRVKLTASDILFS